MTAISDSQSVLLSGMQGSRFPIAVAHGEGLADFSDTVLPIVSDLLSRLENPVSVVESPQRDVFPPRLQRY